MKFRESTIIESHRPLRAFLCHSSGDKPAVRELYYRLRSNGIDPWLDEEDLLPGQDWQREIPKAVRESDVVIVCLSRGSVTKTGYVQKEIKFALDVADLQPEGGIFIIPAKLEDCEVPERLSHLHWVNLFEEPGYSLLLRTLQKIASSLAPIGVQQTSIPSKPLSPSQEKLSTQLAQPVLQAQTLSSRHTVVAQSPSSMSSTIWRSGFLFGLLAIVVFIGGSLVPVPCLNFSSVIALALGTGYTVAKKTDATPLQGMGRGLTVGVIAGTLLLIGTSLAFWFAFNAPGVQEAIAPQLAQNPLFRDMNPQTYSSLSTILFGSFCGIANFLLMSIGGALGGLMWNGTQTTKR